MSRKDKQTSQPDRKTKQSGSRAAGGSSRKRERLPPRQNVTWQGGAASIVELAGLPAEVAPPGTDFRLVLWLEEETEIAVGGTVVEAGALPGAVADLLIESMQNPKMGSPRRPRAVVLRDPDHAAVVRERLAASGVEVHVEAELPLWEGVVRSFLEQMTATRPPLSYLEAAGVTPEMMAEFFRAAADYYQAAPWTAVEDDTFELHLPGRTEPIYATVMGGGGVEYGLALYFSLEAVLDVFNGGDEPETFPDALAVTFDPESELPDAMREERRRYKWKVAGPSAFPVPMRSLPPAEFRNPTGDEIAVLITAMDAMREFVGKHGEALARFESVDETVRAGDAGKVRVIFPAQFETAGVMNMTATQAMLQQLEEEHDIGPTREGEGGRTPLITEMQERMLSLPNAAELLRRLAWSFFRSRAPIYLDEEDEGAWEEATARFVDWAFYLAPIPPHDQTWAEMALQATRGLSREARAERERFIRPVYGAWAVVRVDKGESLVLRSVHDDKRYHVRERMATYQIRKGWTLFGPLFPISADEWVLGTMSPLSGSIEEAEVWQHLKEVPPEEMAPLLESSLHGAHLDWVEDLERRRDVKEVWDGFREDLGGWLYSYPYLERKIREADSAARLLQAVADRGDWWTDTELEVAAALLMRAWNVTTRPDLGGQSPEQMHQEPQAVGPEERRMIQMMGPAILEAAMQTPPRSATELQESIERLARGWLTTPHTELEGRTPEQVIEEERRQHGTLGEWRGTDSIIESLRLMGMPI
jgi:hypothetical protein